MKFGALWRFRATSACSCMDSNYAGRRFLCHCHSTGLGKRCSQPCLPVHQVLPKQAACLAAQPIQPLDTLPLFSILIATRNRAFQVSKCYPKQTARLAAQLMDLLDTHATVLDAALRRTIVQVFINELSRCPLLSHSIGRCSTTHHCSGVY